MWEGGSSIREISEHLGVARFTVWKWTRRWEASEVLTDLRKFTMHFDLFLNIFCGFTHPCLVFFFNKRIIAT